MDATAKESRANFDTLMEAHVKLQAHMAEEREAWARQEDRLRRENAELRAQLLYTAAQLATAGIKPSSGGKVGTEDFMDGTPAAAELPTSAQPSTPQQSSGSANITAQQIFSSTSPDQRNVQDVGVPSWAAEIEAAMEAVDHVDILTENVDYSELARKRAEQTSSQPQAVASPLPTPTPSAPAAVVPPPPPPPPVLMEKEEALPVPTIDSAGPPPPLCIGADDIFWMNQLHTALVDSGFYPGDADIDDYYFGDSTQSAVQTFQACEGLDETGVVDEFTWIALLGSELTLKESRDLTADQLQPYLPGVTSGLKTTTTAHAPEKSGVESGFKKPFADLFTSATEQIAVVGADGEIESSSSRTKISETHLYNDGKIVEDSSIVTQVATTGADGGVEVTTSATTSHVESKKTAPVRTKWPVLIEGDGGHDVHALHVLLEDAGYSPGEDDVQWWQFGDSTIAALKTYQACSGLPESGVADTVTWKKLLGPDASPNDLDNINSGRSDDDDMADDHGGSRVWLLGEQRWENLSKMNK